MRRAVGALLLVFTLACDRSIAPSDSIAQAPEWRLALTPRVSIGVADGDERYAFRRVAGVLRTRDGRLLVADYGSPISLFDSAGVFVRSVGGTGSGPGEYTSVRMFTYRGDSIAVWDFTQRRITVFDRDGTFGRTISVIVPRVHWLPGTRSTSTCCRVASALADGSFVLEFPSVVSDQPGPERYGMVTLARVHATCHSRVRQLHETMRFEFAVVGDTIVGGNGEGQFLLRVAGNAQDTVRLGGVAIPITDSIKSEIARSYRDEFARNPKMFEGRIEEAFEGQYADVLPAYTRVTSDAAGRIWLGQWAVPHGVDSMTFHIYTQRGEPVARIRLPRANWVSHLGADHLTLVESDSLGVQYVRVYDILRPR
jgi:hypothetical protein